MRTSGMRTVCIGIVWDVDEILGFWRDFIHISNWYLRTIHPTFFSQLRIPHFIYTTLHLCTLPLSYWHTGAYIYGGSGWVCMLYVYGFICMHSYQCTMAWPPSSALVLLCVRDIFLLCSIVGPSTKATECNTKWTSSWCEFAGTAEWM